LVECDFEVIDLAISNRYRAYMELYAQRK